MAYADLGGLGLKQGAPVAFDWVKPSLLPQVLPWLAILLLLLLKPNRCASAWWIWVPLGCVAGVAAAEPLLRGLMPSSQLEDFLDLIGTLAFGVAAVWLLSSYLGWKHRLLAFLGILLAQGGFSLLTFLVRQGRGELGPETLVMAVSLLASVLVVSVALSLAGLACRGRYGWLILWLMAALVVMWCLVIMPFFLLAHAPVMVFFAIVGVASASTFGLLLPFLVLSLANPFYRERLKGLLHLGGAALPPVIPPAIPAAVAADSP